MPAQAFDFGKLLAMPAFQFGTNLLFNGRQPGAIGQSFGLANQAQKSQQDMLQAQMDMQDHAAQRKVQEAAQRNLILHQAAEEVKWRNDNDLQTRQLDQAATAETRRQQLADQTNQQAAQKLKLQQALISRLPGMSGLFGPSQGSSAPDAQGGAAPNSYEFGMHPPGITGGVDDGTPIGPINNFNPDDPRDLAGPMTGKGRGAQFGSPSMQGNRRPTQRASWMGQDGRHGTPAAILDNLAQVESSGNPYAVGPPIPSLGGQRAMGAYQFTPDTVRALHAQGVKFNPWDPQQARDAADYHLQQAAQRHGGSMERALADYGGFKTKDPSQYISKVLGGDSPTLQTGIDKKQAQDMATFAAAASIADLKGGPEMSTLAKILEPDTVAPGSWRVGPDGKAQLMGDPYKEKDQNLAERKFGLDQIKVANDTRESNVKVAEGAQKVAKGRAEDTAALGSVTDSMNSLEQTAIELSKHPGLGINTGLTGATGLWRLTPSGRDAGALLESLKSKNVVNTLKDLKQASSNGSSGFGSLSNSEGKILETLNVNLNRAQTTGAVQKALTDLQSFAKQSKARAQTKYKEIYGELPQQEAAPAPSSSDGAMSLDDYIKKHKR